MRDQRDLRSTSDSNARQCALPRRVSPFPTPKATASLDDPGPLRDAHATGQLPAPIAAAIALASLLLPAHMPVEVTPSTDIVIDMLVGLR